MPQQDHPLGELELEILKIVWERQPCTVSAVAELMAERRGYARTTVLTVMQRLAGKGFLKRRKRDGVFHYSATKKKSATVDGLIKQFVNTVLDGSPLPFVAYLAESGDLTSEQARTLRAMARRLEQDAKEV